MEQLNSVEEILDFAIGQEQGAQEFYQAMADRMTNQAQKKMFEEFVAQERAHEAKLKAIKANKTILSPAEKVMDLKIVDYSIDVNEAKAAQACQLDVQEAYLLAMKKEKAAFRMYTDLAGLTDKPEFRDVLLALAQEEARHKLKLEIEYDDNFFAEN